MADQFVILLCISNTVMQCYFKPLGTCMCAFTTIFDFCIFVCTNLYKYLCNKFNKIANHVSSLKGVIQLIEYSGVYIIVAKFLYNAIHADDPTKPSPPQSRPNNQSSVPNDIQNKITPSPHMSAPMPPMPMGGMPMMPPPMPPMMGPRPGMPMVLYHDVLLVSNNSCI